MEGKTGEEASIPNGGQQLFGSLRVWRYLTRRSEGDWEVDQRQGLESVPGLRFLELFNHRIKSVKGRESGQSRGAIERKAVLAMKEGVRKRRAHWRL